MVWIGMCIRLGAFITTSTFRPCMAREIRTDRRAGKLRRFIDRGIELQQQVNISATRLIMKTRPEQPDLRALPGHLCNARAYGLNLFGGEPHE